MKLKICTSSFIIQKVTINSNKNGAGGGKKDEKKVYDAYQKTLGFDTGKKKQP